MRYPWAQLNPRRFEELTKEYLIDKYPGNDWILLPQSGDGNRDLEAITTERMFDQTLESKQWVEAKYTRDGKRALSKGQLDPTIVSVLLDNKVQALMFLTNSRYTLPYMHRAKQVLSSRLQDRLHFVEGQHLEAWLDKKPGIVSSYFSGLVPIGQSTAIPRPTLVSAKLMGTADYLDGHLEARESLYQNEELILVLVVNSQADLLMKATVEAPGLALEPTPNVPASFRIHTGRQIIPLRMIARQKHPYGKAVVSLWDSSGDYHCTATFHYSIEAEILRLDCAGQLRASQSLDEVLRLHQDTPRPGCVRIIGTSGGGKSYILKECLKTRLYRPFFIHVFNESGQNARGLCRSLLFLSFGIGIGLEGLADGGRFKSGDFQADLVKRLAGGMNSSAAAKEALESLLVGEQFAKLFTLRSRGDAKVLMFDDIQKADELSQRVVAKMLEQLGRSDNRTLVVLAMHPNYTTLDDAIRPLLIKDINVEPLISNDVKATLSIYLQPEAVRILEPEIFQTIKTVLELRYLASELRSNSELMSIATENAIAEVRTCIVAASIPQIATRIHVVKVEEAADLVAILDAGVAESFLVQQFNATVVAELLRSELFECRIDHAGAPKRIVSSHDLLRAAYLKRRNIYSKRLAERIESLLKEEPHRRNDILGHLCLCGEEWRERYLSEALEVRDALLSETRFGAARSLSHTLYNLVHTENIGQLGIAPEEHLSILFGYADCVNHTEGSGKALPYFDETIRVGKAYKISRKAAPFVFQAKAERFNMRFWQHDLKGFQVQAEDFLKLYDNLPLELQTPRILEAKMTVLNRLMMVEYLLDATTKAEEVFSRAWDYTESHGYDHDRGNLLMDQAKSIMMANPVAALKKMEQAGEIYAKTNTQIRRQMVCRAQVAYLRTMLGMQSSYLVLEGHALALREEGFSQEYANCLMQLVALHLVAGRHEDALESLDELGRQNNALEHAPRRSLLYHHLRSVATMLGDGPVDGDMAFERHIALSKVVGQSYLEVAQHNISMVAGTNIAAWAFERRTDAYWLEPRLW